MRYLHRKQVELRSRNWWRVMGLALFAVWTFAPPSASAQRLWIVGEVSRAPDGPAVVMEGVAVGPGLASPDGAAPPRVSADVQVTYDYLRLGFGFLELPLPDGSTIEAENAVFEDRGDGNLMWTGEVLGAGYESVLFTVQDGHLVGWFGEPGDSKYVVHAGPDGYGSLAVEVEPSGDWCGVREPAGRTRAMRGPGSVGPSAGPAVFNLPGAAPSLGPGPAGGRPGDGPPSRSVSQTALGHWPYLAATGQATLDFVVVYTSGFARAAESAGGVSVVLQAGFDYLNLVFRNGRLPAEARLMAAAPASPDLDDVASSRSLLLSALRRDPSAGRLRQQHDADFVHAFAVEFGVGGLANLYGGSPGAGHGFGVSSNPFGIFAHEVGHNLGGHHEPESFSNFAEVRNDVVEPFAFAHVGRSSEGEAVCSKVATGYHDCSYEPYYSSVRHHPQGWVIGVAGERENERVFHDTVPEVATIGALSSASPLGPSKLEATVTGERSVRLTWEDNAHNEDGFHLSVYGDGDNRRPPVAANATSYALDNLSASSYRVHLRAFNSGHTSWWDARAELHGFPLSVGAPMPPYGLDAAGAHWRRGFTLNWGDSAADETGFRVRQVDGGSGVGGPSPVVAEVGADQTVAVVSQKYLLPGKHTSSYVVEAFNSSGTSRSESLDVERVMRFPLTGRIVADDRVELRWGEDLGAVEQFYVTWGWRDDGWNYETMLLPGTATGVTVEVPDLRKVLKLGGDVRFAVGIDPDRCRADRGCAAHWGNPGRIVERLDRGGFVCYDRWGVAWERIVPLGGRWDVTLCFEDPVGWQSNAWDYHLESRDSGLMYFFDRDNVEALVKVLNGCAINGHHWVFVAPVTDLKFQLRVTDLYGDHPGTWLHENRVAGRTARTRSDTTAFPCTTAEVATAKAKAADAGEGAGAFPGGDSAPATYAAPASATRLLAGAATDCTPSGPALTLSGGYTVSMCYETSAGAVGQARDWGLDSSQSALLYFFDRNNVEVLIKVLDGCGVNGHRWVFVAPVTDLAFNLHVESPAGERWIHRNRLGQTADAAGDTSAFPCSA